MTGKSAIPLGTAIFSPSRHFGLAYFEFWRGGQLFPYSLRFEGRIDCGASRAVAGTYGVMNVIAQPGWLDL